MKKFLIFILVLAVAVGALGYWRGWFSVKTDGNIDLQVDGAKVKQDKEAFSKSAGEKSKTLKDQLGGLWKKSEGLSGDDKAQTEKELGELTKKQARLEQQIKELDDASSDKFETIKQDLSDELAEVEKRIEELARKLEKGKDKKE